MRVVPIKIPLKIPAVKMPPVPLVRRVIEIITAKDIDWMELFTSFLTSLILLCLFAPGDYFGTTPRLHSLQHLGQGITLPEIFWQSVFSCLLVCQLIGIAAGGSPVVVRVTHSVILTLNPSFIRMRVMALNVGVFGAMFALIVPTTPIWWIGGFLPFPVSIGVGLFFGLAAFCFAASCRMAAQLAKSNNLTVREMAMVEAANLLELRDQVDALHQADEISARLSQASPKQLFAALVQKGEEARFWRNTP